MPTLRKTLAATGSIALVSAALVVGTTSVSELPVAAAPSPDCAVLDPGEYCEFTYDAHPNGAELMISTSVPLITVLVTGGSGAPGEHHGSGAGGAGALVIAELPMTEWDLPLTMVLGAAASDRHGAPGWSSGGDGGDGIDKDGGGGGGSTMVTFGDASSGALIVAGGGGGGGGCVESGVTWGQSTCNGGGDGGSGGHPPQAGANGSGVDSEANGNGGAGGGSGSADGADGDGVPLDITAVSGGGGGGGGWLYDGQGGSGGDAGGPSCGGVWTPQCHAENPGAGGGGGGGGSMSSTIPSATWTMMGAPGHGSVVVIAGQPVEYRCGDTSGHEPSIHTIPSGVEQYVVVAVAGSGSRGHNYEGTEGKGAAVSAVIDVTGLTELAYWVGCSPYSHSAAGYGWSGHGGDAPDFDDMDGGDGGAATMIAIPGGDDRYHPLVVAGGGGGSGGDELCLPGSGCNDGGLGGNGGGVEGTANSDHGTNGSDDAFGINPGRGGCGACVEGPHGGHGTAAGHDSGGGGGGGAGYPYSGHGGGVATAAGGGGGGAGGSYLAPHRIVSGSIGTDDAVGDGFILFIALDVPKTSLTVTKSVTGAASAYGVGPFGMHVTCVRDTDTVWEGDIQIGPGGSHTIDALPVGAACTVQEVDAGGASTPAPPTTVDLTDAPTTVVMTNEFASSSFSVTVSSSIIGEHGTANPGVAFDPPSVNFFVTCRVDGRVIKLPGAASTGFLRFGGSGTWAPGGWTQTVTGVPVGAQCGAAHVSDATDSVVHVDGAPQQPLSIAFTTGPEPTVIEVEDEYELAPLEVSKAVDGSGIAPPDHEYGFAVSCTFHGNPVTLPVADQTITVPAGATGAFHDLPIGATCAVVETDAGGASAVQYLPGSHVGIGSSGAAVQVTNTFSADPLTVTLANTGAGASWANSPTQVQVACTLEGTDLPLIVLDFPQEGGSQTAPVDDGAVCAVSSVSDVGQTAVTYASTSSPTPAAAPVPVTVAAGAGLRVENVFDVASIEVTSANSGDGAAYANVPTAATVTCLFNGQSAGPSVELPFGEHGGTGTVPSMVVGAVCEVVQSVTGGATSVEWTVENSGAPDAAGASVTVTAPGSTVAIDNVFDLAGLDVTTAITGDAAWAANTGFTVAVTCTFNGLPLGTIGPDGVATLGFDASGAAIPSHGFDALAELPVGASCTADETERGGATEVGYVPGATVSAELGSSIQVVNRFDATSLGIAATVSGNDAANHALDSFYYDQSCTFNGALLTAVQTTPAWTGAPVVTAGQSVTFAGLPVGAECTVTEVGSNHATEVSASTQTATLAAAPTTLSFDNTFDVGPLTLTQVVDGPGAATYADGQTFVLDAECTYGDGTGSRAPLPFDGLFELSETASWSTTVDVPLGATCSVVEAGRFMATTIDVSGPVVIQPDSNDIVVTSTYELDTIEVVTTAVGSIDPQTAFGYVAGCMWQQSTPIPLNEPADSTFELRSGETMLLEALMGAQCSVAEVDDAGAIRVDVTASGAAATTTGVTASAYLRSGIPADFAFVNFMPGSLPVTGSELRWFGIGLAALLLLAGAGAFATVRRSRSRTQECAGTPASGRW
jgi:Domain of unknown function (DUF5979)/Glycine rich protein